MLPRHAISDADWDRIKGLLAGQPGQHGGVATDNRRFIDAVLWIARTGAAWADLPERQGNGTSQWRRFDRCARAGRRDPILADLRDPDLGVVIVDSTAVHAHPCAAGAKKTGTGLAARTTSARHELLHLVTGRSPAPDGGADLGPGPRLLPREFRTSAATAWLIFNRRRRRLFVAFLVAGAAPIKATMLAGCVPGASPRTR
jgi:transposase